MKAGFFMMLLGGGIFLWSFNVQAKVRCVSPATGDSSSEATNVNSVCHPTSNSSDAQAVNRDVNVSEVVSNLTSEIKADSPKVPTIPTSGRGAGGSQ